MAATIEFVFKGSSQPGGAGAPGGGRAANGLNPANLLGAAGRSGQSAANMLSGAGTAMGGSAGAGLAAAAGPIGVAVAAVMLAKEAFTKLVDTVRAVNAHFEKTTEQLAQYSGAIAASKANSQIADILADIKRAEQYGGGLAGLDSAKADLSRALTHLADEVLMPLVPVLTGAITIATDAVNMVGEGISAITQAFDDFKKEYPNIYAALEFTSPLLAVLGKLKELGERRIADEAAKNLDALQQFMAMGAGYAMGPTFPQVNQPGQPGQPPVRMPAPPANPNGQFAF